MSDSLQRNRLYSPWNSQARILEWVDFPSSSGSFQPRDWTQVFLMVGGFFTKWSIGEVHMITKDISKLNKSEMQFLKPWVWNIWKYMVIY